MPTGTNQTFSPEDITALLGELSATKSLLEASETALTELTESSTANTGAVEQLDRYKTSATTRFTALLESTPDYIKKHISAESFENAPLDGIEMINSYQSFANDMFSERSGEQNTDPTQTEVDHKNTAPAAPKNFQEAMKNYIKDKQKD